MKKLIAFLLCFPLLVRAQSDSIITQYFTSYYGISLLKENNGNCYTRKISIATKDSVMRIYRIEDPKGKIILRNKNGDFFNLLALTVPVDPKPAKFIPPKYEEYNSVKTNSFLTYLNFISSLEKPNSGYYGKGDFKEGVKDGLWYEGQITEGDPNKPDFSVSGYNRFYAQGNYVNGKKEGIWEHHFEDIVLSGMYVKGKPEGKWTYKKIILNNTPNRRYGETDRVYEAVEGNFLNGMPHGLWTQFSRETGNMICQSYFSKGKIIGFVKYYYWNTAEPQLEYKADVIHDSIVNGKFYCPLGVEVIVKEKNVFPNEHTHASGYYHAWGTHSSANSYDGWYKNHQMDSVWRQYRYRDTVSETHYKGGVKDGKYWQREKYSDSYEGQYCGGTECGLWIKEEQDNDYGKIKSEIQYKNGKGFLKTYWINDKKVVDNGAGVVYKRIHWWNGKEDYEEIFYNEGMPYKTVRYYGKTNQVLNMASITYHTSNGDSLASYWDGSYNQTVQEGAGYVMDESTRSSDNKTYYLNGKSVTPNQYKDSGKQIDPQLDLTLISIKREVKKYVSTGEYEVNITIDKGALSGFANYQELISLKDTVVVRVLGEGGATFTKRPPGTVKFSWQGLPGQHIVHLSYRISGISQLNTDFPGYFRYVVNGSVNSLSLEKQNITYVEVK